MPEFHSTSQQEVSEKLHYREISLEGASNFDPAASDSFDEFTDSFSYFEQVLTEENSLPFLRSYDGMGTQIATMISPTKTDDTCWKNWQYHSSSTTISTNEAFENNTPNNTIHNYNLQQYDLSNDNKHLPKNELSVIRQSLNILSQLNNEYVETANPTDLTCNFLDLNHYKTKCIARNNESTRTGSEEIGSKLLSLKSEPLITCLFGSKYDYSSREDQMSSQQGQESITNYALLEDSNKLYTMSSQYYVSRGEEEKIVNANVIENEHPGQYFVSNTNQAIGVSLSLPNLETPLKSAELAPAVSVNIINPRDTYELLQKNVFLNCLPTVFEDAFHLRKIEHSSHICDGCFKITKTSYGCSKQLVPTLPNLKTFENYNSPNGYTLEFAQKHGSDAYIYISTEMKNDYDPKIKRYYKKQQYTESGKRLKRDYPSLCLFCKVSDVRSFDQLFYERNNSCYRGHLINTHGISSSGEVAKLPQSGFVCYKLGKNIWSETVGFRCPYEGCNVCFLKGDKTHGFHEYIRHWNRSHISHKQNRI